VGILCDFFFNFFHSFCCCLTRFFLGSGFGFAVCGLLWFGVPTGRDAVPGGDRARQAVVTPMFFSFSFPL
jgi:hypothetical protein